MQRAFTAPALDGSLIPPLNSDLANIVLDDDAVHAADLSGIDTFTPTIIQVRADGDFQWATAADPVQGTGPWLDGGVLWSIPVAGLPPRFIRRNNGGATVNVYLKALGSN